MPNPPLGQQYHERVEELISTGMKRAAAIKQVAAELDKEEGTIRGGIYSYKKKHPTEARAPQSRDFDSYLAQIDSVLIEAKQSLEADVQRAKEALDAAQAAYDAAVKARDERLPEVEDKLKALRV